MTKITVIGRATADCELRFTPSSGKPVASFTLADNHRRKDGDQWVDDGATFYQVSAWDHLAEQCAEAVLKGKTIIVVGDVRLRQYETRDGSKGSSLDIRADEVGLCLPRFPPRDTGRTQERRPQSRQVGSDPWATPADEPPFYTPTMPLDGEGRLR